MRFTTSAQVCLVVVLALLGGGCLSRGVVYVVDVAGAPIAAARIEAHSLNAKSAPEFTDAAGRAVVPGVAFQETISISVSKEGYVSRRFGMPTRWPFRVTLQDASTSP